MKRALLTLLLVLLGTEAMAAQAPSSLQKNKQKPKLIKHIETIASGKTFADRQHQNVQWHLAPLSTKLSIKF